MTSLECGEVLEDPLPPSLSEPNTKALVEPSNSGNGVVVRVTQHPLDQPLRLSAEASQFGRATPTDPFGEGMEKGLSCLSLEVMTSGEHLDALSSMDDLSSDDVGSGSGRGSSPGCVSLEGEGEGEGDRDQLCGEQRERDHVTGQVDRKEDERPPNDMMMVVEGKIAASFSIPDARSL